MSPHWRGYFRASRGDVPLELIQANPNAYVLASVIAHRARWREGFNPDNLELGEAMLGDHARYGMSEQEYRTAKAHLSKWGFATFRATNKGTIGKLMDTRLFDVLNIEGNDQNNGPHNDPDNGQTTTQTTTNQSVNQGIPESDLNRERISTAFSQQEVTDAARRLGLCDEEAKRFFDHYDGNNLWCNRDGKPIKLEPKLRAWARHPDSVTQAARFKELQARNLWKVGGEMFNAAIDGARRKNSKDRREWLVGVRAQLGGIKKRIPEGPLHTKPSPLAPERDYLIALIKEVESMP